MYKRQVQSVNVERLSDFRCSVCGGKLVPVKESNLKKTLLIAAGIVVAAVATFVGVRSCGADSAPEPEPEPLPGGVVTVVENTDSLEAARRDSIAAALREKAVADSLSRLQAFTDSINAAREDSIRAAKEASAGRTGAKTAAVLGGAATKSTSNGYVTLTFVSDYNLDLGKADRSKLRIRKGERIERADIRHGVLRGGTHVSSSGEENSLTGLNVRL